jgi:hypothetical protein
VMESRVIHKSAGQARNEVRDLLETIFIAELISPSRCLWVVSPWVSDIVVVDNRGAGFDGVDPTLGSRVIRLSDALARLVSMGATICIACRPIDTNQRFLESLRAAFDRADAPDDALTVVQTEHLHEKGLLGDDYYLSGSMNLTYSGVELLDEMVRFELDVSSVAAARVTFHARYGGRLTGSGLSG